MWVDVRNERITDLSRTVSILDRYLELTFFQRERSLFSIGEMMLEVEGPEAEVRRLEIALTGVRINKDFMAIGLAQPDGQITTFTGSVTGVEAPNLTSSSRTRRSFAQATMSDNLVIGEAYYFDRVDDWVLPIRVPIRDPKGLLRAVNTSAISYKSLHDDFATFNMHPNYKVQFVNSFFNTNQIIYPLAEEKYPELLGKSAAIYSETVNEESAGLSWFKGYNKVSESSILGVTAKQEVLNHELFITVDTNVLWTDFWDGYRLILGAYISLIGLLVIGYRYFLNMEHSYNSEIGEERDYSARILEGTPNMVIAVNSEGECTRVNPAIERVTGYVESEIIGKKWWSVFYPNVTKNEKKKVLKEFERSDVRDREIALFTKNGDSKIISWNYLKFFDREQKLKEIIGFGTDVTSLKIIQSQLEEHAEELERVVDIRTGDLEKANQELVVRNEQLERTLENLKTAQKQLVQSEKMASLGMLSAGIGHEINNPLNFIKGGTYSLSRTIEEENDQLFEKVKLDLETIDEGVDRASQIVKSLSHFTARGFTLEEKCNVNEILENCLVILSNRLKHKVEVVKQFDEGVVVSGNEGKLHQAFVGILNNAEEAIEKTGIITIKTSTILEDVVVEIIDEGRGISDENLSRIQEPFFTTKDPGQGTGLGLYMASSIIHEHSGNMEISSEIGKGTHVKIKIPRRFD